MSFIASYTISSVAEYLAILDQKLVEKTYDVPGPVFFPFVTDLASRVESMKRLLLDVTDGKGSRNFLFRYFPSYDDYEKPPPPTGTVPKEPWTRAGHPDFYMNQL